MAPEIAQRQRDRGKGCLLKEQSREHAWHVPRLSAKHHNVREALTSDSSTGTSGVVCKEEEGPA